MICHRCLRRASALGMRSPAFSRPISTSVSNPSAAATSTSSSTSSPPAFSTPLSLAPNTAAAQPPKPKSTPLPTSIAPAGTSLKGINYLKSRDDPIALPESEYPPWLWRILDAGKKEDDKNAKATGDEFSKSKKQRRIAAKQQRKQEAKLLAAGDLDALAPKIPLQHQTIDLPGNDERSLGGALEAVEKREELRRAMRVERRAKIKERNFLKGMR